MIKKIMLSTTIISTLSGCDNIIKNIKSENKYCSQLYCKDISKEDIENPKINKPIDIAVSNDGKNVYVINKRIGIATEVNCENSLRIEIPREYIYKINDNKNISVLKINDNYGYSCYNRELIESDKNSNLYTLKNEFSLNQKDKRVNISKQSILKINTDFNIEKEFNLKREEHIGYNYIVNQLNVSKFDNNITYDQVPFRLELNKTANKINENGSFDILFTYQGYGGSAVLPFIFEDNRMNFGGGYIQFDDQNNQKGMNEVIPIGTSVQVLSLKMNSKKEVFVLGSYYTESKRYHSIYKIVPNKGAELFAGSTEAGYKDGNGKDARFNNPSSLTPRQKG